MRLRAMLQALLIAAAMTAWALFPAYANAATYEVCWNPPTSYEDGTPLLEQDLDYYTLYIDGNEVVSFDAIVGTWCYQLTITEPGTYATTMTVTDINAMTSVQSNAVSFTVGPRRPRPPIVITVAAL